MTNLFDDPYEKAFKAALKIQEKLYPELHLALNQMLQTLDTFDRFHKEQASDERLERAKEAAIKNADYLTQLLREFKQDL